MKKSSFVSMFSNYKTISFSLLTILDNYAKIRVPRKRGLYFCAHFYRGRYTQLLADFSSNTLTEVPNK